MSNNLPRNWSWVKLSDICKVKGGFAFKSKDYKKEGVPLVRISNIEDKKISLEDCVYIQSDDEEKIKEFILHKGDILIALSGATTGKYGIYNHDQKAFLNQRIGRLHFNGSDTILPVFIYLYLEIIRSKILQTAYGAAQPNISPSEIADFPIPLPPLPEQKKIVEKIEELFSGFDSGVASLKKAKEQLRLYRQSVLASAFSGKLVREVGSRQSAVGKTKMLKAAEPSVDYNNNGLPKGWKWVKLGEIVQQISGCAFKSNDFTGKGVLAIKISNIGYSEFVIKNQEYLPDSFLVEYENYIINADDLLIALTRPITNDTTKVCFYPTNMKPALLNQRVAVLKSEDIIIKKYAFYYFQSEEFKKFLKSKFNETLQPNLSPKDLVNAPIPLSNRLIQTQIVEEIEKSFSEADNLEKTIDDSLEKSEALRQSILKQAFEGKLV